MSKKRESHLKELESKSIYILREAFHHVSNLGMLWSMGKDSTVLVHLCKKAFFGHLPFPLIHIDTSFKIPKMIEYRDQMIKKWKATLIVGQNEKALKEKKTYPDGAVSCLECCKSLKTEALRMILKEDKKEKTSGYIFNHETEKYESNTEYLSFNGLISGIRADEEGSRSKERYFSVRGTTGKWTIEDQPPEFWSQFNTEIPFNTHLRIHPLLDWTELDIWVYIQKENIPVIDLYFDQGKGKRFRSIGCYPCTYAIESTASSVEDIIKELTSEKLAKIAERSGRAQDKEDGGGLEFLRQGGYM